MSRPSESPILRFVFYFLLALAAMIAFELLLP